MTSPPSLLIRACLLASVLWSIALVPSLFAQSSTSLRVDQVRFLLERSPYGGKRWLEMEIEVEVRGNVAPAAANPDFVDDLEVEVAMAQNLGTSERPRLEYFWTRIEIPTLERGTNRLRFYLPPEQVERGRIINDDPYAWYVRIAQKQTSSGAAEVFAVSANLREQTRLHRFLELLDEQKASRSGILLPQPETPFRDAYPDDTPSIKGQDRNE